MIGWACTSLVFIPIPLCVFPSLQRLHGVFLSTFGSAPPHSNELVCCPPGLFVAFGSAKVFRGAKGDVALTPSPCYPRNS